MSPASPIRAARPRAPRMLVLLALLALSACRLPWDPDPERDAVLLSGSIDAHEVDLSFQAPGRILRLVADEGRHVAQGDVVAELDPLDIELALARARAQEQSARKALAVLRAGSRAQEIASAQAAVQQAQADSNFANHEVDRTRDLIAKGFESDQALDRARSSADTTAAKLEQARQNLSLLKEGPRHEDIDRAAAELAAAHAEAESAQRQLGYVKLMSPAAGVISVRLAEAGQVVTAGQPVFRLAQLDRPWVRAYLAERDLPRVKLGQDAQVRVDGLPGKVFEGRLAFISPVAEFTPKTVETRALRVDLVYRVTVDVDNAQAQLKIGMPADVTLPAPQK